MRNFIILLFMLMGLLSNAQARKRSAPYTIRGAIGIPRTISSQMFRTAFNGVYETNLSVNARLMDNFFAGIGYQNTHFQNNKNVFAFKQFKDPNGNLTGAVLSYNTRLNGNAGFLKIGYDKFFEKGYVSYAVNVGYMMCEYQNVNNDTTSINKPYASQKFGTPYVQPELGINFMTDGRLTFSLLLSYSTMLYKFDPKAPRFKQFGEVNDKRNSYFISWINIGFGFNVLLGKL